MSIDTVTPIRDMGQGIQIILKNEREEIAVHLGPAWFILYQDMILSVNDKNIEVRGCRTMINGKPVIMASAANPADLRIVRDGETGIVVPYDNIDSVSKAILRLLDDGETRKEMGKAGRSRVEELYDMRRIAESTQAIYAEILSKRSEL